MSRQGNSPRPPISRRLFTPQIVVKPAAIAAFLIKQFPTRVRRFQSTIKQETRP